MDAKQHKSIATQLTRLSTQQLIALATQKELMPYPLAKDQTREALIEGLRVIEGVLVPVKV